MFKRFGPFRLRWKYIITYALVMVIPFSMLLAVFLIQVLQKLLLWQLKALAILLRLLLQKMLKMLTLPRVMPLQKRLSRRHLTTL